MAEAPATILPSLRRRIAALHQLWQRAVADLTLAPDGPLRLVDALEGLVYQHGLRHLGEVEHARALVGLRGLT